MLQIFYKYLILHNKASIPGVGFFHISRQPASLDFSNKAFVAPSAQIAFTENAAEPDKKFLLFFSKEKQIQELEAEKQFGNFTQAVKDRLQVTGKVDLPGFGLLERNETGALQFEAVKLLPSFYTDAPAERTIRKAAGKSALTDDKTESNRIFADVNNSSVSARYKKDYWWIFAIVLAVAAIAAIVYYYIQNGTLR